MIKQQVKVDFDEVLLSVAVQNNGDFLVAVKLDASSNRIFKIHKCQCGDSWFATQMMDSHETLTSFKLSPNRGELHTRMTPFCK